ncbi:hypothetical protein ACELLULO517_11100 [Acidisoma cellulosilytica]|uniref:Uncharacterized protein n=1 Tax=Acidisoma cellulosilyticum TaxID=2802395 RepID=A0A963Z1F1_9PROT|nr:hypothetical protein [Acidisoma cellulosilyticum]MCB8880781.1 hypothetical protein [Acidisoma cellulosilyticum]
MTQTLSHETLQQTAQEFPVSALPVAEQFVLLAGADVWAARIANIAARACAANRVGGLLKQRHALELAIDRMLGRESLANAPAPSVAEQRLQAILAELVTAAGGFGAQGRARLQSRLQAALQDDGRLVDLLHVFRTAALQQARGFTVAYDGLEQDARYDLLLRRDGVEVECICETISAEAGRDVHRFAWAELCDRVEGQMKPWLDARPGRYLLKMTLAAGLRDKDEGMQTQLHDRVVAMLESGARLDQDPDAVLRIEPLVLSGNNTSVENLMGRLRREFGPEAHFSVSACAEGIWAMAARAGRRNEVAALVRRDLSRIALARVSSDRPAILATFVEDIDRPEWRGLMDSLELEGAARHFMTADEASNVVAVTCYSRMEMFGLSGPDAAAEGELRFRNPAHPAAKISALAPAILSSL